MRRVLVGSAIAVVLFALSLIPASAQSFLTLERQGLPNDGPPVVKTNGSDPVLEINRIEFCTSDSDWTIFISNAAPNSSAFLEEFRFTGSTWVPNWSGGVGSTNGSGQLLFVAGAPITLGSHISYVTIAGQTSNPVFYNVFNCAP